MRFRSEPLPPEQVQLALSFVRALACADFAAAHSMCSEELRSKWSAHDLKTQFRSISIEEDQPIDLEDIRLENPDGHEDRETGRLEYEPYAYVTFVDKFHSSAVVVHFAIEHGLPRVGDVEWGRP